MNIGFAVPVIQVEKRDGVDVLELALGRGVNSSR